MGADAPFRNQKHFEQITLFVTFHGGGCSPPQPKTLRKKYDFHTFPWGRMLPSPTRYTSTKIRFSYVSMGADGHLPNQKHFGKNRLFIIFHGADAHLPNHKTHSKKNGVS